MVDQNSINSMKDLLSRLNATAEDAPVDHEPQSAPVRRHASPPITENASAMKTILEGFYRATSDLGNSHDSELQEAMSTSKTDRGTRVGSWEIVEKKTDPASYDVVHAETGDVIASDLYLYEAAYGLVRTLNRGGKLNSKPVRDILNLEEEYARNRDEAASQRHLQRRLIERGEDDRASIAEARFDEAKRRAIQARGKLKKLVGQ